MHLISIVGIFCVILNVYGAPQRFSFSSDESSEEDDHPLWFTPAHGPVHNYGAYGDELTKMFDDLQKSLLNPRVASPKFPTFSISTSTGSDEDEDHEDDDDDHEEGGTSGTVSIGGTGFGTGFGGFSSLFNNFGGFDTKDLKNKTTVKTEIINGQKVTTKEHTYVSDNGGFKAVVHLSEVEVDHDGDKPAPSKPESGEDSDKESEDKPKKDEKPETATESNTDEDKSENPEVTTQPETTEQNTSEDNDEDNDLLSNRVSKGKTPKEPSVNPDSEVEQIETLGGNSNYYKYNTAEKIREVGKKNTA